MTRRVRRDGRQVTWIRRWYGAHPLHLLALLTAFALAGYAVSAVVSVGQWTGFIVWFAVAIIGHDLLLFPLYTLADLSVRRLLPGWAAGRQAAAGPGERARAGGPAPLGMLVPPALNYIRVPAAFSLLIFLVWFPLILGLSERTYHRASGLTTGPYLGRWLVVTGALFGLSAAAYALALRRAATRARKEKPDTPPARP